MNIAGRADNANKTRLNKMVQKKSKNVTLAPMSSPPQDPFLFVGNESAPVIRTKKTSIVKFPSFPEDVALGLIEKYSRWDPSESVDHINMFPQIKGARYYKDKAHDTRSKCNPLESQGRTIFTEGLSSISTRNEPSLVFHRRDLHCSNMPETIKFARQRSKVVFSVRSSDSDNKTHSNTHRQLATGISAAMSIGGVSRSVDTSKNEPYPLHESPISKAIKKIEQKYGISPCVSPYPDTPGATPLSDDNYTSNYSTPRRTPKQTVHVTGVNVVSLTPDFKSRRHRSPCLRASSTDERYNQREAFRQHKHEQRVSLLQMPCDVIQEEKIALRMSVRTTKPDNQNKLFKRYNCEPGLPNEFFAKRCSDSDSSVADKSILYMKKTDGSFQVRGVFGTSVSRQDIWVPGMPEEEAELTNPPPSTESTYVEDLVPNIHETKMMTPLQEESTTMTKDESQSLVNSSPHSCPSTPVKRTTHLFEVQPIKPRNSHHSGMSSNFLTVPRTDTKTESRPGLDAASASGGDDDVVGTEADVGRSISTQTNQQCGVSEIKPAVQTLELFLSTSTDMPSINLNDNRSSPDPMKKVKKLELALDATDLDYVKDYAIGKKSQESVHNKAIMFMSPLDVEENAKRQ